MFRAGVVTSVNIIFCNRQQYGQAIWCIRRQGGGLGFSHQGVLILAFTFISLSCSLGRILASRFINLNARFLVRLFIGRRLYSAMAIARVRRYRATRFANTLRPSYRYRNLSYIHRSRLAADFYSRRVYVLVCIFSEGVSRGYLTRHFWGM